MTPGNVHSDELREFLGADLPLAACRLVLPHFAGSAALDTGGAPTPALEYRGATFAERDSRAAFYVQSLVSPVFEADRISIETAAAGRAITPTTFLFGSRSNVLVEELKPYYQHLFRFEFGDDWKICCGGQTFSVPDPSRADLLQYRNSIDYGIIARLSMPTGPVFVVAGLGGRATEGSAYYLRKWWRILLDRFNAGHSAVVLQFDPPFELEKSRIVYPSAAAGAH